MTIKVIDFKEISIKGFILVFLFCMPVYADNLRFSPEDMKSDMDAFYQGIIDLHPSKYQHISKEDFENSYQQLVDKLDSPMPLDRFFYDVSRWVNLIKDGHTWTIPPSNFYSKEGGASYLPFHFHMQDNRLYVVRNMSSDNIRPGSEIISINNIKIEELLTGVRGLVASDGGSDPGTGYSLTSVKSPFYKLAPSVFNFESTVDLTYRRADSNAVDHKKVKLVNHKHFFLTEKKIYGNNLHIEDMSKMMETPAFSVNFVENGVGVIRINRFVDKSFDEDDSTFRNFYKKAFSQIENLKTNKVIIDLRGNGGGKLSNFCLMLRYLVTQPFITTKSIYTYANDDLLKRYNIKPLNIEEKYSLKNKGGARLYVSNDGRLKDMKTYFPVEEYAYKGDLVVLVDGGTVSAGANAAGLLQHFTDAVLIGEETGGYAGISNGVEHAYIKGEKTGITVAIPLLRSETVIHAGLQARGALPRYSISPRVDAITQGRDEAMNFAMKYFERN